MSLHIFVTVAANKRFDIIRPFLMPFKKNDYNLILLTSSISFCFNSRPFLAVFVKETGETVTFVRHVDNNWMSTTKRRKQYKLALAFDLFQNVFTYKPLHEFSNHR